MDISPVSSSHNFGGLIVSSHLAKDTNFQNTFSPVADKLRRLTSNKYNVHFYPEAVTMADTFNERGIRLVVSRCKPSLDAILQDMRALIMPDGNKKAPKVLYKTIKKLIKNLG